MANHSEIVSFGALTTQDRRSLNGTLSGARNATMLGLIGNPRSSYTSEPQDPDNPAILAQIETRDMGPFKARGLIPALDSLVAILADVQADQPDLLARLGSAGMLACRYVRGSATSISNHSWGTAIDLTIDGKLDPRGDGRTQRGLFSLLPHFNRHGFFWGAAFPTEDAMHFEASDQLIRTWAKEGRFGSKKGGVTVSLTFGDHSAAVEALQNALNRALAPMQIEADGIFGRNTRAMVIEFQRRRGLTPSGQANAATLAALGLAPGR